VKRTGADLILEVLRENSVDHIFGVPGGHLLKLYDSFYAADDFNVVLTKHEAGAAFMACGFAQVSGRTSVAVGTVGPGATNLISGVATAYMDSIPMLVITAQVGGSTTGKGGLQEATGEGRSIDHCELFRSVTKHSMRISNAGRLADMLSSALRTAINGRPGPVHVDIPADVFSAEVSDQRVTVVERFSSVPPVGKLTEMATLLAAARRPAILAGRGSLEAAEQIALLAHRWKIPVATTLPAKGVLPEDDDLSLGTLGIYGTVSANKYLRSGIDVLLAVGVSFHEFTTHAWDERFAPKDALLQIDVDPWELGKNYAASVAAIGSAKPALEQLVEMLGASEPVETIKQARRQLADEIVRLKADKRHFDDPKAASDDVPIKPQRLMRDLRMALPLDALVFGDIGNSLTWLEAHFPVLRRNSFFIGSGLASMGYGVAACVGGKLAAVDRPVVCICGDGDFQMQGMEVLTAVNYGLPVTWIVLNNGKLGMIQDVQDILFGGHHVASAFRNPDFVKFAEACGARGFRVTEPGAIVDTVESALACGCPAVIDIVIDPDEAPPFDARAEAMVRAWGQKPPLLKQIKMIPELMRRH
jgi:acetolactate synthase-1/2/3 large subunit